MPTESVLTEVILPRTSSENGKNTAVVSCDGLSIANCCVALLRVGTASTEDAIRAIDLAN